MWRFFLRTGAFQAMSDSKRSNERRIMFRVCRYNIQGREYADLSTNISEGGIFIKNFSPPSVGTVVTLTVRMSEEWDSQPMKIVGRVVHINDDPDPHKRGMGIEFLSVTAETVPMIQYFIREIYRQEDLTQGTLKEQPASGQGKVTYEYHIQKKGEPDK
jgi:c-di-GMP-binding flagellar brake protein YcgR